MSDEEVLDLYAVLGVDADATAAELRRAHRRAARLTHPDTGRGSTEAMELINRAWACLGDPTARAAYDRAREQPGPKGLAPDADADGARYEDPVARGGGPSRRLLVLTVLAVTMLVLVSLVLTLLIGFTQAPGTTGRPR